MFTKNDYAQAYVEVLEILKYIQKKDVQKIPREILERFQKEKAIDYKFVYDKTKKIKEQKISEISRAILAMFYRDYWATEYERKVIIAKQRANRKELEELKIQRYKNITKLNGGIEKWKK